MDKKYCIDTSSLLDLAKYFAPFDNGVIEKFLQDNFQKEDFIVLNKVFDELQRVSKGLVLKKYPFLERDKKIPKIKDITADKTHHSKLDENWVVPKQKNNLNMDQFEQEKQRYISGADFQIIAFCMEERNSRIVISEETPSQNDGKLFKKIPAICQQENIECQKLVWLLKQFNFSANYKF